MTAKRQPPWPRGSAPAVAADPRGVTLERDGLISRTVLPASPPGVEYAPTPLGRSLQAPIETLTRWAARNHGTIRRARKDFDRAGG